MIRKEEYERGIEAGKEQGLERGLEQGLERGIMALITSCKEFEVSFEETRKKIQEKFSLDERKSEEFMKIQAKSLGRIVLKNTIRPYSLKKRLCSRLIASTDRLLPHLFVSGW